MRISPRDSGPRATARAPSPASCTRRRHAARVVGSAGGRTGARNASASAHAASEGSERAISGARTRDRRRRPLNASTSARTSSRQRCKRSMRRSRSSRRWQCRGHASPGRRLYASRPSGRAYSSSARVTAAKASAANGLAVFSEPGAHRALCERRPTHRRTRDRRSTGHGPCKLRHVATPVPARSAPPPRDESDPPPACAGSRPSA